MRQVWLRRGHLVVEPDRDLGRRGDGRRPPRATMAALMRRRGLGSWLLVPIGMGEEYLGTMGLGRAPGARAGSTPRSTPRPRSPATSPASSLDARLMERERAAQRRAARDQRLPPRHGDHARPRAAQPGQRAVDPPRAARPRDATPGPLRDSLDAMDRAARRIEDMIEDLMALASVSDPDRGRHRGPSTCPRSCGRAASSSRRWRRGPGSTLRRDIADGQVVAGRGGRHPADGGQPAVQRREVHPRRGRVSVTRRAGATATAASGCDLHRHRDRHQRGRPRRTSSRRSSAPATRPRATARHRPGAVHRRARRAGARGDGRGHLGGRSRYDVRRLAAGRAVDGRDD